MKLYKVYQFKLILFFIGAIKCVCFSCDGQLFASASYDHAVRVYDAATGIEMFCLKGAEQYQARGAKLYLSCSPFQKEIEL